MKNLQFTSQLESMKIWFYELLGNPMIKCVAQWGLFSLDWSFKAFDCDLKEQMVHERVEFVGLLSGIESLILKLGEVQTPIDTLRCYRLR